MKKPTFFGIFFCLSLQPLERKTFEDIAYISNNQQENRSTLQRLIDDLSSAKMMLEEFNEVLEEFEKTHQLIQTSVKNRCLLTSQRGKQ